MFSGEHLFGSNAGGTCPDIEPSLGTVVLLVCTVCPLSRALVLYVLSTTPVTLLCPISGILSVKVLSLATLTLRHGTSTGCFWNGVVCFLFYLCSDTEHFLASHDFYLVLECSYWRPISTAFPRSRSSPGQGSARHPSRWNSRTVELVWLDGRSGRDVGRDVVVRMVRRCSQGHWRRWAAGPWRWFWWSCSLPGARSSPWSGRRLLQNLACAGPFNRGPNQSDWNIPDPTNGGVANRRVSLIDRDESVHLNPPCDHTPQTLARQCRGTSPWSSGLHSGVH